MPYPYNPASASLGGFKESASAFRFCRHCLGSASDIQTKVCFYILYWSCTCHNDCMHVYEYTLRFFLESQFELRRIIVIFWSLMT